MESTNSRLEKPTLFQAIAAILVAAFMWGSGNVLSRSLLIEGVDEIFLVTVSLFYIWLPITILYHHIARWRTPFPRARLAETKISPV